MFLLSLFFLNKKNQNHNQRGGRGRGGRDERGGRGRGGQGERHSFGGTSNRGGGFKKFGVGFSNRGSFRGGRGSDGDRGGFGRGRGRGGSFNKSFESTMNKKITFDD